MWLWVPAAVVAALALIPIVYLVIRASESGSDVWGLVWRERTGVVLLNTMKLVALVGLTTVIIAVPMAWLVIRIDLPGRRFFTIAGALPLVIPSYAGALAYLGMLGPRGFAQGALEPLGVERLPSFYGLYGAWMILSLFTFPYVFLAVRAQLFHIDPALEEAAASLGRHSLSVFLTATLSSLRIGMTSGVLLAVLYTMSDFGVVTLMRYDAFTRVIYTQYNAAFDRTYAAVLGLILVVIALALVYSETIVVRRSRHYRVGSGSARAARTVKLGSFTWLAVGFC